MVKKTKKPDGDIGFISPPKITELFGKDKWRS